MAGYYFWARFTFPVHVVTNHWSQYSEVPLHKFCWTTFSPREKKLNQITWHWSYAHMVHTLFAPFHICLKVDQHSVLNEDSAIKWQIYILRVKQEAHGPHRSPEKTVQINKLIWLYNNINKEKKKNIINFMRIYFFFIWKNLNPLHPRLICAEIGWNWLIGSGEEDFLILSMYFHYFVIIFPLKRAGLFIWSYLYPLYPRMLCAKFG